MTQTDRVSDAIQEFWRAAARVIWKGLDETNGQQFLVLELVDGETLDKRIALGPIPIAEALSIATQVAEPLEAAHEKADSELDSSAEELKGLVPTK